MSYIKAKIKIKVPEVIKRYTILVCRNDNRYVVDIINYYHSTYKAEVHYYECWKIKPDGKLSKQSMYCILPGDIIDSSEMYEIY